MTIFDEMVAELKEGHFSSHNHCFSTQTQAKYGKHKFQARLDNTAINSCS